MHNRFKVEHSTQNKTAIVVGRRAGAYYHCYNIEFFMLEESVKYYGRKLLLMMTMNVTMKNILFEEKTLENSKILSRVFVIFRSRALLPNLFNFKINKN